MLQQYLPLAVLKLVRNLQLSLTVLERLQQYLPLAVLKLFRLILSIEFLQLVATVPTACGIETIL